MKTYTIYFFNEITFSDGVIEYNAKNYEDAIKQFNNEYNKDYKILLVHN